MKILVAYDGSGYSRYSLADLRFAGLPANAQVLILSIAEVWMPPTEGEMIAVSAVSDIDLSEFFRNYREQKARNLEETVEIADEAKRGLQRDFPGWTISSECLSGSAASIILSRAEEFAPDLLVLGPRGLSSDDWGGLGSVAQKLLSHIACSVRIVRARTGSSPSGMKIVIGFDDTPGSTSAVEAVVEREWPERPDIRLVTVTDPFFPLIPGHVFQPIPNWSEEAVRRGERKWAESHSARALRTLTDAGYSPEFFVYGGNPRMILPREAAAWGADSIFIGAGSRSDLHRAPLGSVSSAIASRASCTVEVVRRASVDKGRLHLS